MWLQVVVFTTVVVVGALAIFYLVKGFPFASRVVVQTPTPDGSTPVPFTLYYAEWCPYSKTALENWGSLQSIVGSATYGGNRVILNKVDCNAAKSTCQAAGIEAYPTYKLQLPTKVVEYNGPPNATVWDTFLQDALGTKVVE